MTHVRSIKEIRTECEGQTGPLVKRQADIAREIMEAHNNIAALSAKILVLYSEERRLTDDVERLENMAVEEMRESDALWVQGTRVHTEEK